MKNKNIKGFTLIELLIVISILSILMAGAYLALNPAEKQREARDAQRVNDIRAIQRAIELYKIDHDGVAPPDNNDGSSIYLEDQNNNLANALVPNYLAKLPVDPKYGGDGSETWGKDYEYDRHSDKSAYLIRGVMETKKTLKQNYSYPDGTTCQNPNYPECTWTKKECVYVTGTNCDVYWFHLGGI